MKAREIPQQKTEGGIDVRVLNRMTSLGMPESVKVSWIKTDRPDFIYFLFMQQRQSDILNFCIRAQVPERQA